MRLPSIPGPREAQRLLEQVLEAVPRMTGLLTAAERLVADAGGLVADVGALLVRIESTRQDADALLARTEVTRAKADQAVLDIEHPVQRLVRLLDALEPPLLRLEPVLGRLAESTSPAEVDAAVGMVDRLPELLDRVEDDVLPLLGTLATVGPDMRDLLDLTRDLNEMLGKLPGMGRIKKRIDEEQAAEADAVAAPG